VETIAEAIKDQWVPPPVGNLHWDGKIMQCLETKYEAVERLPVLVSGMK